MVFFQCNGLCLERTTAVQTTLFMTTVKHCYRICIELSLFPDLKENEIFQLKNENERRPRG